MAVTENGVWIPEVSAESWVTLATDFLAALESVDDATSRLREDIMARLTDLESRS